MLRRRMMMTSVSHGLPENGLVYKLPEKTIFTGSNNIDTGVYIFRDYNSFTLFSDVEFNVDDQNIPSASMPSTIIACMWEAMPYPGFTYRIRKDSVGTYITDIIFGDKMFDIVPISKGKYRIKMAFSVENKTIKNIFYQVNGDDLKSSAFSYQFQASGTIERAVLTLGSYKQTSGAYGRYFIGEMNQFALYDNTFTETEIKKLFEV